ncbi:hypothetical protein BKA62DRAFT_706265 [Auriculariales sp. MPI-PUGE-AT-0066]|nr:hypothetical protein BKA62DRAFT_706265 [Auriculariales sp. MPI-PUGE-AT-0066]
MWLRRSRMWHGSKEATQRFRASARVQKPRLLPSNSPIALPLPALLSHFSGTSYTLSAPHSPHSFYSSLSTMRISLVIVAGISSVIAAPLVALPLTGKTNSKPITLDVATDEGTYGLCVDEHGRPVFATGLRCDTLKALSIALRKRNLLLASVLTGDNGMVDVLSSDNKPEPALINLESGLRRRNLILSGVLGDENTIVDVLSSDNKPEAALIDLESGLRRRNLLLSSILTDEKGMVDVLSSDNKPEPALINLESGLRRRNLILSGVLGDENTIVDVLSSDNKPEPALIDLESAMARRQVSAAKSSLRRHHNAKVAMLPARADRLLRRQLNSLVTTDSPSSCNAAPVQVAEVNINSASNSPVGTASTGPTVSLTSNQSQEQSGSQPTAELDAAGTETHVDVLPQAQSIPPVGTNNAALTQMQPIAPAVVEISPTVNAYSTL